MNKYEERTCRHCQKPFQILTAATKGGRGQYCSRDCHYAAGRVDRVCGHCGKAFTTYRAFAETRRYCSLDCRKDGKKATRVTLTCGACGKEFATFPSQVLRGRTYCSQACYGRESKQVSMTCIVCGAAYTVLPKRVTTSKFCSYACMGQHFSKTYATTPATAKTRTRKKRWLKLRKAVLDRDGNRCTKCGMTEGRLHAHHINGWDPSVPDSLETLTTLCTGCHRKEHR